MEQAQDMIRVGVVPSMIGAEGDAPIVVSVPRNTSPDQFESVALAEARKVSQPQRGTLAVTNPMNRDQSVGFNLPPVAGEDATDILKAFPQLAGLIAQFTPASRMGFTGAAGVPAAVEMLRQIFSGEDIDLIDAGEQGLMGVAGHGVGRALSGIEKAGGDKIVKSLGLPADTPDAAIDMHRNLARREGARITREGEDAIRAKAQRTGLGGLDELADSMSAARRADEVAPSRTTFWPNEAAANFLRRPHRQMAVGQAMSKAGPLAKPSEAVLRALMALASAMGAEGEAEPPLETSRGPRRRGGSQ